MPTIYTYLIRTYSFVEPEKNLGKFLSTNNEIYPSNSFCKKKH